MHSDSDRLGCVKQYSLPLSIELGYLPKSIRFVPACETKYCSFVSIRRLGRYTAMCSSYVCQPEESGGMRHVRRAKRRMGDKRYRADQV